MKDGRQDDSISMLYGLKRVLRYGIPYWKIILLTFLCMVVYSVSLNGRAYLIKPFLEEVIIPATEMREMPGLGSLDLSQFKADIPDEDLAEQRAKLTDMAKRPSLLTA